MQSSDLLSLIAAVPLPALVIGGGEKVIAANAAATEIIGQAPIGRHYMSVLRKPELLTVIEQVRKDGRMRKASMRQVRSEGDTIFEVHCSAVPGPAPRSVMLWFEDVTHLEQAGRMRRDFVANVSHELRTPLTALMGFIETLQGPARDDAEARDKFLGIMAREAARMERLVSDLLSLSRVEVQERQAPRDQVDLAGLLVSVSRLLGPTAEAAEIEVAFEPPDGPVMVTGDEDQLRQVLSNLVENALKYGASGKWVGLKCYKQDYLASMRGPAAIVEVRDAGQGIDPLHIPRLTERFYRVDSHRSREIGGTGLGLAIVKHIVNRHRGRLKIDSELGQGSTFSVILPLSEG
ncbi:two-component sensor histidine kinase [Rhodobacteraceae bacterium 63075]|nr:two-component sensor histidine kinase [Rhodobacteraceae bacterium 63075]